METEMRQGTKQSFQNPLRFIVASAVLCTQMQVAIAAEEPIKVTCGDIKGAQPAVRFVGQKGDLVELFYEGARVYYNPPESRDWMGGGQDKLHCDDVYASKEVLAIRMGWKHDLIMVFGFDYDKQDKLVGIWKHGWTIRDGDNIGVSITRNDLGGRDVLVTFGWKKDLHARLCFDKDSKKWRRNANYRGVSGFPQCDMNLETSRVFPMN